MEIRCFLTDCYERNKLRPKEEISFFYKCPEVLEIQSAWLVNIPKNTNEPNNVNFKLDSSRLCHLHFANQHLIKENALLLKDGRIVKTPRDIWILTENAVPTLFTDEDHVAHEHFWTNLVETANSNSNTIPLINQSNGQHSRRKIATYFVNNNTRRSSNTPKVSVVGKNSVQLRVQPIVQEIETPEEIYFKSLHVCILCNQRLKSDEDARICLKNEERQKSLRLVLSEVFGVSRTGSEIFWLSKYSKFPFCGECETIIDDLQEVDEKLKFYQAQFDSMKNELVRGILRAFCKKKAEENGDPRWKFFCQSEEVLDKVFENWSAFGHQHGSTSEREEPNSPENIDNDSDLDCMVGEKSVSDFDEMNSFDNIDNSDFQNPGSTTDQTSQLEMEPMLADTSSDSEFEDEVVQKRVEKGKMKQKLNRRKQILKPRMLIPKSRKPKPKVAQAKSKVECSICKVLVWNIGSHMSVHGVKRYKCSQCEKCFTTKSHLLRHEESHIRAREIHRLYHCGHSCSSQLRSRLSLQRHQLEAHFNKEVHEGDILAYYDCDFPSCLSSYPNKEEFYLHLTSHFTADDIESGKSVYKCSVCEKMFGDAKNLELHQGVHDGRVPFDCSHCHLAFDSEFALSAHKTIHDVEVTMKTFPRLCDICGKFFRFPKDLSKHKSIVHHRKMKTQSSTARAPRSATGTGVKDQKKKFICEVCGRTCSSKVLLNSHMFLHKENFAGLDCSICHKKFRTPNSLQAHRKIVHQMSQEKRDRAAQVKIKWYASRKSKCEHCHVILPMQQGMMVRRHLVRKHPEIFLRENPFYCTACWKTFATQTELDDHYKEKHTHLKCTFCGRQFATKTRKIEHERLHTGSKPFVCEVCGKAFTKEVNCKMHTRIHNRSSQSNNKSFI